MKKIMLAAMLSYVTLLSFSQKKVTIHGEVSLLSGSKNVSLSGPINQTAVIRADGSFDITGEVTDPGLVFIKTDSSGTNVFWLEAGDYRLNCKEKKLEHGTILLIPSLKGPADAQLYNDFNEQGFEGFGIIPHEGEEPGSVRARQKARVIGYMDSVLKLTNTSLVLPLMVRSSLFYVGDEAVRGFIGKLSAGLKNDGEIALLQKGFDLKDKIRKEKVFENFTLEDTAGRPFMLSSLTGKKAILIDFWASGCGPCRMEHPLRRKWYAKYAGQGLEIVSISIDDSKDDWMKAVRKDSIGNWVNVCDFKGWEAGLVKSYYVPFIPFSFLLDGDRNIVLVDNKQDSWIREKDITALLGK